MGQRFQVYVKTKNEVVGFHLQWSWGIYSLIRAYQILEFADADIKSRYSDLNTDFKVYDARELLRGLTGINFENKSYVRPRDLSKSECENPSNSDNNDGALLIDVTKEDARYCFFNPYDEAPKALNALKYVKGYKYSEDTYEYIIETKYLELLAEFKVLQTKDLKETFPKMYS